MGTAGLHAYPVDRGNVFLQLIELRNPAAFLVLVYGYATLWFTTPFFAASMLGVADGHRRVPSTRPRQTPRRCRPTRSPSSDPRRRSCSARRHFETTTGPCAAALVADDSAARPLHRRHGARRRRHRQDVRVHVSRTSTSSCAGGPAIPTARSAAWSSKSRATSASRCAGCSRGPAARRTTSRSASTATSATTRSTTTSIPTPSRTPSRRSLNNLFGKSKEPFWQQAYTDLLKFVILLRRITDGYTTFAEVYRYILDDAQIDARHPTAEGRRSNEPPEVIVVPRDELPSTAGPASRWTHWFAEDPDHMAHPYSADLETYPGRAQGAVTRSARAQGTGVGWTQAPARSGGALVSRTAGGGSTIACDRRSPKASSCSCRCSTTTRRSTGRSVRREAPTPRTAEPGEPRPLPPLEELLEAGQVLALNFPVGLNPGLARALGVMLKLDFQRAVLQRIPKIAAHPERIWRDLLFVCDEYHAFATVGETDPTGDERTFALSRQARLIPIVATQSISSLRSALPGDESWRTLLQCFRTKLFLATSDEFTAQRRGGSVRPARPAQGALHAVGRRAGRAHLAADRAADGRASRPLSASKSYAPHHEYIFAPRVFTELQNAQAIALPYDGLNPLPPQFCYLKPHYLDVQTSYFDHLARGQL